MKKAGVIALGAISGVLLLVAVALFALWPSPEAALKAFYTRTWIPEETVADPLIVAGDRVVPLVVSEIGSKSMPNRAYAIGFLAEGRYKEALPALLRIVTDETESEIMRGRALAAIWSIDEAKGRRLAERYAEGHGHLSARAISLQRGLSAYEPRRTRLEAVLGWLDP